MRLRGISKTEWSTVGAAFCGGALATLAVIGHEVYTVLVGRCPDVDPFTHVMAELAAFAPGGAIAFALAAEARNWLVRAGAD